MAGKVEVTSKKIIWREDRTIPEGRVELSTGSEKKPIHREENHAKNVSARTGEPFDLNFTVDGKKDETLLAKVYNNGSRSYARLLHFGNGDNQKTLRHNITVQVPYADKEKHKGEWSLRTYYHGNEASASSSRGVNFD